MKKISFIQSFVHALIQMANHIREQQNEGSQKEGEDSVLCPARGNGRKWYERREQKKMVLCPLQGIARWKSNNNIFNSTNEFCFSYLFRIPRRLKCSLGCLLHYLLFHPCYFFFSIHLFGHQRVGEGETEETMQFHL